ncbi:uncharacterized protein K02A2.6-like [Ylistrum balloti]|uniref:uncharacterized protein K02A2.6-like n=1 Tax=Ylistrum balloti TaxID=509963 RepID=UPI002905B601|nr:uncharacterized protein K02A2.6-like [Ylistrum balloti]
MYRRLQEETSEDRELQTLQDVVLNILTPELPSTKSYEELKAALTKHYSPKPLVIGERFKFHNRKKREEESVSDYVVSLKKLAKYCEFGDVLNQALRDRLVCGLRSEDIQKKLLAEKDLDLARANEIALAMEMATKDTEVMSQPVIGSVNVVNKGQKYKPRKSKYWGTERSHSDKAEGTNSDSGKSVAKGYKVNLGLNGCPVQMEIDTGAAVTICSEKMYTDHLLQLSLQKPTVKLKDYGGVNVPLRGEVTVPVTYGNQSHNLLLRVACGNRPSLLGRNWLSHIKLDWPSIFTVTQSVQSQRIDTSVKEMLVKHHKLFQKGLGTIQKFKAQVKVQSDVQPIFCKARAVPFSLKEALEKELHRLENEGIVSRVEQSDWATPVVIVPKADKSIRLSGDFKVTVNKCLDEQQYPLPNVEDMFAQLTGGQKFTKLNLSQAYQQLTLDEDSEKYLTITTHLGLFRYHRLPFGVASAPAIFQSVMDQILQGVPHTMCCIDDILVTAPSDSEHIKI